MFCNGLACDCEVGVNLIRELGLPEEKLLPAPKTARELLELVCSFDIVFGARLHSCITSVSLGIPVAGLLWDDKLVYFSNTMNIQQYFSSVGEIDADKVFRKIENLNSGKIDMANVEEYKQRTLQNIKRFLYYV